MAFCTECGHKLPEEAVFCPNCGATVPANSSGTKATTVETTENVSDSVSINAESSFETIPSQNTAMNQEVLQGSYNSMPAQDSYAAPTQNSNNAPVQGSYNPPMQGEYTAPMQGNYNPQPYDNYTAPMQNGFAPQYQNQYSTPEGYGYQTQPNNYRMNTVEPKSNGGKIAAIVISAAVVLLALAGFFIHKAIASGNSNIGYWESCAVDTNGVQTENYEGENVVGLLGIQINKDGTAFMCSATDDEIYEGKWEEKDDGITVINENDTYEFTRKDGKLYLDNDTYNIVFKKNKGDINHPTIPHGSLANSGEDNLVDMPGTVIGSGNVGNDKYYIEVIGAEDITDVDGDSAMRVYFNFTNNFDYPIDAYNALGLYISQDGNDLPNTYASEGIDANYNLNYKIRTGITIQCCQEFKYNPKGGAVTFSVCGWDDGEEGGRVDATIVPGSLPGVPSPYVIKPVADPQWTRNIAGEGTLDDYYYVSVENAELVDGSNGKQAVRVYYEFTNNSSNSISMAEALIPYTYQDGISLDSSSAQEDSDTDINFSTKIAPGATVKASCIFALRNTDSPIEAEVEATNTFNSVGQTYHLN